MSYNWPGNVRELENKIKRAVVMAEGKYVTPANLELKDPSSAPEDASTLSASRDSREKDLVDLVAIANTQTVDATRVRTAIMKEARLRGLGQVVEFSVPSNWGPAYEKEARKVPVCERHLSPLLDSSPTVQL